MSLIRAFLRVFTSKVGSAAVSFGGTVLFANLVGASGLGSYFLFVTLLTIFALIVDLGIKGAVQKRISDGSESEQMLGAAILLKTISLTVLLILVLSYRSVINSYVGAPIAVELSIALVLHESSTLLRNVLAGELRVSEHSLLELVKGVMWVMIGIVLIRFNYEVLALIYGQISGLLVVTVWALIRVDTDVAIPSMEHALSLISYGKHFFISSVGSYSYNWVDVAILGLFVTQTEIGAYEVAWRITVVATLFGSAIETTVFPQMSQWEANGARRKIEELIPKATAASLAFVLPALVGGTVLSREILIYLFGAEFGIAWLVLIILLLEKPFNVVTVVVGRSLQAVDQPKLAAKAATISTVANILLNLVLIYYFGIVGAAVATTLSYTLNSVLHYRYASSLLEFRFPTQEVILIATASALMGLIVYLFKISFGAESLPTTISLVVVGVVSYVVIVFTIPQLRSELIGIIDSTWDKA